MTKLDPVSHIEKFVFYFLFFLLCPIISVITVSLINKYFFQDFSGFLKYPILIGSGIIIPGIIFLLLVQLNTYMFPFIRRITGIEDTTKKVEEEKSQREWDQEEEFRNLSLDYKMNRLWQRQKFLEKYYFQAFVKQFNILAIMLSIVIIMLALMLGRLLKWI